MRTTVQGEALALLAGVTVVLSWLSISVHSLASYELRAVHDAPRAAPELTDGARLSRIVHRAREVA